MAISAEARNKLNRLDTQVKDVIELISAHNDAAAAEIFDGPKFGEFRELAKDPDLSSLAWFLYEIEDYLFNEGKKVLHFTSREHLLDLYHYTFLEERDALLHVSNSRVSPT
ncbi:MAG TPA: hypothetical protein VEK14_00150 [Rhodomicrobium sp.]|nr:hypothetical protein [Rhodomicrobium sp.]